MFNTIRCATCGEEIPDNADNEICDHCGAFLCLDCAARYGLLCEACAEMLEDEE